MSRRLLSALSLAAVLASAGSVFAAPPKAAPALPAVPADITMPSSVGAVTFRHQMHIRDLGIKCGDCHHQIDAKRIDTPHPGYFSSSWIKCQTCHRAPGDATPKTYACSSCHPTRPKNIADETLSAKVVVHTQCWKCHEVGSGKQASTGCGKCHAGAKKT